MKKSCFFTSQTIKNELKWKNVRGNKEIYVNQNREQGVYFVMENLKGDSDSAEELKMIPFHVYISANLHCCFQKCYLRKRQHHLLLGVQDMLRAKRGHTLNADFCQKVLFCSENGVCFSFVYIFSVLSV